jgi:predicted dithiol-disulfide oxidoreductase (DUF899 family)
METKIEHTTTSRIVSREEWLEERRALLIKEKELTRLNDRLSEQRRLLPWVKVDKDYIFESHDGTQTLSELFQGRSQLIVQHFMFGIDWEEGCVGCSFQADHVDSAWMHLSHHDVSFVAISRAPYHKIEAYKKRMGWKFNWVSSYKSDFNFDYNVSFTPEQVKSGRGNYNFQEQSIDIEELSGISVFYKDEDGEIFHTYSSYARGTEMAVTPFVYLDITPKGRNEHGPNFTLTDWVKHHDKYDLSAGENSGGCCCHD